MVIGGAEYALGAAEQTAIMFMPRHRAVRPERVDDLGHILKQPLAISKKPAMKNWLSSSANTIACSGDNENFCAACRR
jgi:hypothetical protein